MIAAISYLYATPGDNGITILTIGGWAGSLRILPTAYGWTLALRRPGRSITYTGIAGHPDVVRSLAETMLRGAARADGIEIQP